MARKSCPVDCHTQTFADGVHLGGAFVEDATRVWGSALCLEADPEHTGRRCCRPTAWSSWPFKRLRAAWSPNDYVAAYVAQHPDKLIGFASVDPNDPGSADQLRAAVDELGLRGLKVAPIYQGLRPAPASEQSGCFAVAEDSGSPSFGTKAHRSYGRDRSKYSNPVAVDEVAIRHPELRVVVAHLGHPWIEETIRSRAQAPVRICRHLGLAHQAVAALQRACHRSRIRNHRQALVRI